MEQQRWHSLQIEAVFQKLGSGNAGLAETEAKERLEKNGQNRFLEMRREPWYAMLF